MRYILIIAIAVVGFTQCSSIKTETIEGDLHFSFFRIGSYHNVHDTIIEKFENYIDTADFKDEQTAYFKNLHAILKKENLLYSPFVQLKYKEEIINLYLDSVNYEQFKKIDRKTLIKNKNKIVVKAKVQKLNKKAFKLNQIIELKKMEGITKMRSRKLKIENYK